MEKKALQKTQHTRCDGTDISTVYRIHNDTLKEDDRSQIDMMKTYGSTFQTSATFSEIVLYMTRETERKR